jgi:enoyl-CoA hydratase/carnithine racemase
VSFCRPPQNALTTDLFRELDVVLDELEADHALRALIITGTGRFFSSGVDPHILAADDQSALAELLTVGRRVLQRIERSPRPIIAAVNGHAFGGGLEIALACHFRILDHGALVGLTESNLGLIPGLDGIERLVALVGRGRALDYLIFGKLLTATTAATIGLASRVSQRNRALDDAGALAAELSERSQTATRLLLDAVHHVQGSTQALDRRANEACLESARSEEARQAVRRLLAAPSEIERDPSHGERAE